MRIWTWIESHLVLLSLAELGVYIAYWGHNEYLHHEVVTKIVLYQVIVALSIMQWIALTFSSRGNLKNSIRYLCTFVLQLLFGGFNAYLITV